MKLLTELIWAAAQFQWQEPALSLGPGKAIKVFFLPPLKTLPLRLDSTLVFREAELSASLPVNAGVTDPDRRSWRADNLIISRQRRPHFYHSFIYLFIFWLYWVFTVACEFYFRGAGATLQLGCVGC